MVLAASETFLASSSVIPLITRMPLVGVGTVPAIEHFQTDRNSFFLRIFGDFLKPGNTVLGSFLQREMLRKSSKGDDIRTAEVRRFINGLFGRLDQPAMILRVIETLDERGSVHRYSGDGTG